MADKAEEVFSPETIVVSEVKPDGEVIPIDLASAPVVAGGFGKHEHVYELDEQDPYAPHLTCVKCKICSLGKVLKTGDNFTEKDILKADGKIESRKSPLTTKEKTLTQAYQKQVKEKVEKDKADATMAVE